MAALEDVRSDDARGAFGLLVAVWAVGCGARSGLFDWAVAPVANGDAGRIEAAVPAEAALEAGTPADAARTDTSPPPPPCVPRAPPRVIAAVGPIYDAVLAVGDRRVYFLATMGDAGGFVSVPKAGGPVTVLAPSSPAVVQLLVDDQNLYALDETLGVIRISKDGGGPSVRLTPTLQLYASGMGLDDSFVYYSDGVDAWRVPKQGGPATLLSTGRMVSLYDGIQHLRVVADGLFWTEVNHSSLYTSQKDGSNVRLIATLDANENPDEFVTDGTTAYAWVGRGAQGEIVSVPVAGGAVTPVVAAGGNLGTSEDDALITPTTVYWTGTTPLVGPSDGGPTRGIFGVSRATGAVTLVAVTDTAVVEQDETCLYWLDGTQLYTVAK